MDIDLTGASVSMPVLGWFTWSTLVVAGFSLSSCVSHFFDWLYQKRGNDSLAFGLICLAVAGHATALVFMNRALTVADYVLALKADLCLLFIAQPAFVWLVTLHMRAPGRRAVLAFVGYFAVLFVANVFSDNSLMASEVVRLLMRFFPGGEPYVCAVLVPSPWRILCLAGTLATYVYGVWVIVKGRHNVERGEAIVMAVSLVCMFSTWLQTLLVEPPMLSVVLMSHYAFLAFILLMGSALSSRYGRQALALTETHRALQESEERFRMLVEKAPDAIAVYDPAEGRFVDANTNATLLFGCSREALLKPPSRKGDPPDSPQNLPPMNSIRTLAPRVLEYEEQVFEQAFCNLQGKDLVCEIRLARLSTTEPALIRASFIDITERKHAERRQLEYQQRLRSLASELALTEERERKRIATYLHDQVAQELVAAQMKLGEVTADAGGENAVPKLAQLREMLGRAVEDTYSLTFELSLPILHELGLLPAIEWLGERVCESEGVSFRLVDDGLPKPLSQDVRSVCFDVVKELLRNVVKHAKASRVTVTSHVEADRLWLVIQDDGIGYDVHFRSDPKRKDGGFGLFSIRERLEYLQGTIHTESEIGRGTRVTLSVLLNPAETQKERVQNED